MDAGIVCSRGMVPEAEQGSFRRKTVQTEEKRQLLHPLAVGGQSFDPCGFVTQEITFRSTDNQIQMARKLNFMGSFDFPGHHQIIPFGVSLSVGDVNRRGQDQHR